MTYVKHNPTIMVANARRRLALAREECAHWDYESDGEGHDCCYEVQDAKADLARARKVTIVADNGRIT